MSNPISVTSGWQEFNSGYTCATCGQWVPFGTCHICNYPPEQSTAPTFYPYPDERAAKALERIADALEKLTKRD